MASDRRLRNPSQRPTRRARLREQGKFRAGVASSHRQCIRMGGWNFHGIVAREMDSLAYPERAPSPDS